MKNELVFKGDGSRIFTNSIIVSELFEKRHDNVLVSIREIIKGCPENIGDPMFAESSYINEQNGQSYPLFIMTRDGFSLLAMGFNGEKAFKFKLDFINAFNKMESELKSQFKVPSTFKEALLLAVEQQELIETQQKQIEVMKPKEEFYNAVTGSSDTIDMRVVATTLNMGIGRNKIFEILREKGVLDRKNIPYQYAIDAGYFRTVESSYSKPDGTNCINIKTVVYNKGIEYIRKIINNYLNNK